MRAGVTEPAMEMGLEAARGKQRGSLMEAAEQVLRLPGETTSCKPGLRKQEFPGNVSLKNYYSRLLVWLYAAG